VVANGCLTARECAGACQAKRGIDPSEWASVDLESIASNKLKRYLEARRAAAAVASDH
jgi:hypothetical protein